MKIPKTINSRLLFILLYGLSANAAAWPITYSFTVEATSGSLAGATSVGHFSFDHTVMPIGGGLVDGPTLSGLHFEWNGMAFDESSASTGHLEFDAAGNLISFSFGTDCRVSGTCSMTAGRDGWVVAGGFYYTTYGTADGIESGTMQYELVDNCVGTFNPDQRDSNLDGFGNACDADLNNDCIVNFVDLGYMKALFFTANPDADLDGDGTVTFLDLATMNAQFFGLPGPSELQTSCDP